jgi:peptidoglycan hydrolase-like protein with peptidoglycan-binding domain
VSRLGRIAGGVAGLGVITAGGWWLVTGGVAATPPAGTAETAQTGRQTATVERKTLTITEKVNATLGYTGAYEVIGGLSGTLTWTVPVGTVVAAGQRLYETDGNDRTSLMYGARPAWRPMASGMTNGADVLQLEQNLKRLGFTRSGDKIDRHWDARTTAAVKRWQRSAGLPVDGAIGLGEIVFLPEAIRVTAIPAHLGTMAGGGGPVLSGTSTRRVVSFDLDAADRGLVEVGQAVQVVLPDDTSVPARITSVSRVATTTTDQGGNASAVLPVTVALDDPAMAGDLDQAAVKVVIIAASRPNVLVVPVNALLALREGGYAVEVVDRGVGSTPAPSASPSAAPAGSGAPTSNATTHLVRVQPGLFDRGDVEITATGIQPGDLVVVPS